jgi:5-formyltetrahydrofolate cyclo-ligase
MTERNLKSEKADLRKTIRQTLRQIDPSTISQWSDQITARILDLPEYQQARAIMVYFSFRTEYQTDTLIREAIKSGKTVCGPKIDWQSWRMYSAVMAGADDFEIGRGGVKQPAGNSAFDVDKLDMILVPGLVFDLRGWRLGRGGGFYDRFFSQADLRAGKVAAAFDLQIASRLHVDPHDQPVDLIVTPTRLMRFVAHVRPSGKR